MMPQVVRAQPPSPMAPQGSPQRGTASTLPSVAHVQVGAFYLTTLGEEQKVVKTTLVNNVEGLVSVRACSVSWSRNGVPSFKLTDNLQELPIRSLVEGPFTITAGRAPRVIADLFSPQGAPGPSAAASTSLYHDHGLMFQDDLPPHRFRYTSALRQLQEMGFQDSPEMRNAISSFNGDVNEVLRQFWA